MLIKVTVSMSVTHEFGSMDIEASILVPVNSWVVGVIVAILHLGIGGDFSICQKRRSLECWCNNQVSPSLPPFSTVHW